MLTPAFRSMWIASTLSNVGGWMQDTAGVWLMTALTTSPLPVALMQTAASLPAVLLGLLGGATADIFDRRRLLLFWQTWMLVVVAVLSVLTFANLVSPWTLLSLTCFLNVGGAMNGAAWQAIVPELVPNDELSDAVRESLRLPWSQGHVEGQVHRLKLIKRQMYGRAGFDLLRLRVLQKD